MMMRRFVRSRGRLAALAAVVVVLGGAACSVLSSSLPSAPNPALPTLKAGQPPLPAAQPAAAPAGGVAVGAPAPATSTNSSAPAQRSAAAADSSAAPGAASSALPDTSAQVLDRMVIRSAQLTVEVQDMESALAQARQIASRSGGIVSASNTHIEKVNGQDRMVADLTLQVRSDSADSALSDLRALGSVTSESSGTQDVTEEYVDLSSNLRNLQASETAILKLMDKATQIQDVLALQRELTNVRGQIERIQGRKTYLERRSDMATITLALRLPGVQTARPAGGWDPIAVAARGWQASLAVLRGAAEVVIVALAFSWWLVPFVALGGYLVYQRRKAGGRPTPPSDGPTPSGPAPAVPAQA